MSKKIEIQLPEEEIFTPAPGRVYLKKEHVGQELVWSIYNESGERMGYAADQDVAMAIVRQNNITPLSVH